MTLGMGVEVDALLLYLPWAIDVTRDLVAMASKDVTDSMLPPIHG